MHSTSKGGHWHFGMKAHIGVDSASGIVHSASVSAANEHDSQQLSNLPHGDSTYANQKEALKAKDFTNTRAYRTKSQTRAKVEHPFSRSSVSGAMPKVRYRGLAKNANRLFAMLALINT